jgi:hypothetical protein
MINLDESVQLIEFTLAGKVYSFPAPSLGVLEKLEDGIAKSKENNAGTVKLLRNFFKDCGLDEQVLLGLQITQLETLFKAVANKKKA